MAGIGEDIRLLTLTKIKEVREELVKWRKDGQIIGFIPTMGYLHEGHLSLIKRAEENDKIVVSIFVNPIQFGEGEDFEAYPRDLERDSRLCEEHRVDLLFYPQREELYPEDFATLVDMEGPAKGLCGLSRPTHFKGVCTVVTKLFHIITPHKAYFGQKDAQQLAVIQRMVKDLNIEVEIVGCPILREPDGLAMSSRNAYLSEKERRAAITLYQGLKEAENLFLKGERSSEIITSKITELMVREPLARIEYIKVVDPETMQRIDLIEKPVLIVLAVFIGKTRLIDNLICKEFHHDLPDHSA